MSRNIDVGSTVTRIMSSWLLGSQKDLVQFEYLFCLREYNTVHVGESLDGPHWQYLTLCSACSLPQQLKANPLKFKHSSF